MIHVLNHNSEIIDFISRSDNVVIHSEYKREKENNSELLDLTILSSRAKHFKENNRIIIQDKSNQYREFIIQHIEDSGQYIDVEATASYVVDIGTAKPIPAGKYEKMSVTQKLDEVLRDTNWVTGDCDYGGVRTNSWTSVRTPYEMISQLETSHALESDFEIIIEGNEVVERRVNMKKPNSLFKGKEIEYGKDLTEMKRTVDFSEVVTALFAFGPEDDKGNRISLVVTDDEAQEQFGLPTRYIWGIYEPESDDENMTTDRLKALARTELNKRKSATVSYEISTFDIEKQFPHEVIRFGDTVRIKNSDFVPSLYAESEVIGFTHDLISDDVVYTFGNVVEYAEDDLFKYFKGKLNEINQKLNDNITNINTIVNDAVAGELEYYERKIFKGTEPPENPQNDTLWYDTSNSDVAVLRRYWNGEWITQTADDVEKIGGLRREQVMYRDLNNSFINLTIQHSKLQNDVYDVLNSEYLVDDDLKTNLNQALLDLDSVYQNIKANLNSMDEETATIGKLVDTQTLFTVYREKLQTLYKYVTEAKISIDRRLKLLQSQYTDEKFNDAMDKIAQTLPNGRWDSKNQQLYADIPNESDIENLRTSLQQYTDGQINDLNGVLGEQINSRINNTKNEISANISSLERKIDGIEVGGRNLLPSYSKKYANLIDPVVTNTKNFDAKRWARSIYSDAFIKSVLEVGQEYTLSYDIEILEVSNLKEYALNVGLILYDWNTKKSIARAYKKLPREVGYKERQTITFTYEEGTYNILAYTNILSTDGTAKGPQFDNDLIKFSNLKLEKGNIATDWTPAPEDVQNEITLKADEISKAQADAAATRAQAYADDKITNEEQARIRQADANLQLLQQQQQSLKDEMAAYADNLVNEEERARMDADKAKEEELQAEISLAQTQAKAYADGIVSEEEKRAIADAISKRDEAKAYAEQQAKKAQDLANQNTQEVITPITTRVTSTESDVKVLKGQIGLMAKSDDVTQQLKNVDGRLTPLETTVRSNKATLDLLPDQINSKVSKQDYTTDQNKLVTRLNNADSERKQLSNSISDKVSLTEYNNGINGVKSYTDNKVNNISVGSRNLLEGSANIKKDFNDEMLGIKQFFRVDITNAHNKLKLGDTITISFDVEMEKGTFLRVFDFNSNYDYSIGEGRFENIGSGKQRVSFTKTLITSNKSSNKWYLDFSNSSNTDDKYTISNIKIEKGNIVTDWTPAPEDIESAISNSNEEAQKAAQAYADAQDNLQLINAKAYADGIVSKEEQRAIADAKSKLETAKADAQTKADAAKETAKDYALAQAQTAQTEAEKAAKAYADAQDNLKETQLKAYADGIVSEEEERAIADAESKLQEAKTHAEKTSNVAQTAAEEYAVIKANDAETNAKNDATTKAKNAEASAKAYTDEYKQSNDIAMTKLETSISQNGDKIALKVDEQKFNASRKTLSQVISEISATTKGINLKYDENGNIQSYTMDRNGIKIDGSKVDINQGDVVIQNGVTTIKDAYIDKLFSKNATIQYLNSIDITAKRLQAVDNGTSVNIENGSMTINRSDGHKMDIGIDGVSMYNPNGSRRFRMDRLFVESAAIGTSNSNVYLAADVGNEVRAVDISQIPSDGIASSYRYVPVRADHFIGNQLIINNGTNMYLGTNDEVRITARGGYNGGNTIYRNVRAYGYYGDFIESTFSTSSTSFYVRADTEVRFTKSGETTKYTDVRGNFANFDGLRNNLSNSNLYFGTDGEVRFMGKSFKNSGVYRDIRFGNWNAMSSEKFKYDIKEWNYSVLNAFRNDLQLYSYKLNSEKETNYARNHHGIIIEREIPIEWRHGDGFDGNEVIFWNTKAIQELIEKVDKLEEQLNEQSITS
ncbi:hypothetical protein BUZ25_02125 [Staphylococcus haemolyticus]|uniref:phage tail spike protein n=1 Tax=Staphylococcus haemolyticus TaxID=1283 RepID=UPI000D1F54C8|nr:phage tail spike protein [Staphylococcus haemolyticus]PTK82004.1 hypothetical protein BUZ25_02125 [Staphylococcus haemolyticus]